MTTLPNVEVGDIWEYSYGGVIERYVVLDVLQTADSYVFFRALHSCTETGGKIDDRFMRCGYLSYWRKVA